MVEVAAEEPTPSTEQAVHHSELVSAEEEHEQQADAVANVIEDDDAINVPPPPVESLGHQHLAPARHVSIPTFKSLSIRQTMVPVLLSSGLMLTLFLVFQSFAPEDSNLAALPTWICLAGAAMGLVLMALGVLNMLLVRQQLATQAEAKKAAAAAGAPLKPRR